MIPRIFVLPLGVALLLATPLSAHADGPATAPGGEDIRDIRAPYVIEEPTPWWRVAVPVAGVVAAAAVSALLLLRRRRGRALGLTDQTLEHLDEAQARILSDDAYAFSVEVSAILRGYLEERFALPASRRTTREFLREIAERRTPELAPHADALDRFLDACDAAKYARYALGEALMTGMLADARRIVEDTRPPARTERRAAKVPAHVPEGGVA